VSRPNRAVGMWNVANNGRKIVESSQARRPPNSHHRRVREAPEMIRLGERCLANPVPPVISFLLANINEGFPSVTGTLRQDTAKTTVNRKF
jgi:hypothetical protein